MPDSESLNSDAAAASGESERTQYQATQQIRKSQTETDDTSARKPLRLWPGVVAAILLAVAWYIVPKLMPEAVLYGMLAGLVAIVAIAGWWLLFSRARWFERLGAVVLAVFAIIVTKRLIDISLSNGAMGYLFYISVVPVVCLALVAWAVGTRRLLDGTRRLSLVLVVLLACGAFTLLRTGGITGFAASDWHFRWTRTPEQRLLAESRDEPMAAPAASTVDTGAEWPGFRGPQRDATIRGIRINTDWKASPPAEMWRRQIGPGWSSFAVHNDLVYTQEQRGDDEIVSCYHLTTGKPVWRHRDSARFWESNAGPGPRGTPTFSNGRIFTLGATGILNALDAGNGATIWSRNAATETGTKVPGWGFAASPLVLNDEVIIALAGKLAAYSIVDGQPRWVGSSSGGGYSSPQLITVGGVQQVLLLGGPGATSVTPSDGKRLWEYQLSSNTRIVQPAVTADGDILVHDGEGNGMRRLAVAHGSNGWTVTERWTSEGLNPYFSDFVIHKGYAMGFDGTGLACIDLKDGVRKWKGGNYGNGQLLLLADQDLLLVLSEQGDVVLVKATPDQFTEVARVPAIKGKTWNHPVLAGDILLVRNGEEMAAFRLARAA